MKTIVSLFDFTGFWSQPYFEAGYMVIQIDLKHGDNIMHIDRKRVREWGPIQGVLAAPPCDDFAVSGARWWPEKDRDGRTNASLALLRHTMNIIDWCEPNWWALENPVGRINSLMPEMEVVGPIYFNPCDYGGWLNPPGDHYTKKTGLWGKFIMPKPKPVEPEMITLSNGKRGSWMWAKLGGKSSRTKELRSATPMGFAKAFKEANP